MIKNYIETETGRTYSDRWSVAPNGSSRSHDFYTTITYVQDWTAGQYAGYSYTIKERWISNSRDRIGQCIGRSSTYLSGP